MAFLVFVFANSISFLSIPLGLPRSSQSTKGTLLLLRKELLLLGWWDRRPLLHVVHLLLWLLLLGWCLLLLLLLRVHVWVPVISPAGRRRLDTTRVCRHAKEIVVGSRCVVVVEIEEGGRRLLWCLLWSGCRSKQIVDRSRRRGGPVGRRGAWCRRSRLGNGRREIIIVVVIVVVIVLHADAGDLSDDPVSPGGNRLSFLDDIEPDGQGRLVAVGSRNQGRLEAEVVLSREGKGVLDLSKGRWGVGMPGFWCQKDVGLGLDVSVFRDKIAVFDLVLFVSFEFCFVLFQYMCCESGLFDL